MSYYTKPKDCETRKSGLTQLLPKIPTRLYNDTHKKKYIWINKMYKTKRTKITKTLFIFNMVTMVTTYLRLSLPDFQVNERQTDYYDFTVFHVGNMTHPIWICTFHSGGDLRENCKDMLSGKKIKCLNLL